MSIAVGRAKDVRLYMFLRILMLFSVLLSTILFQYSNVFSSDVITKTYLITFVTFFFTTVFLFFYEVTKKVRYFLVSQISYDILFTTVLIFYTGPHESIYSIFYFFNIIFTAIFFRARGALVVALASSALFVLVTVINTQGFNNEKVFSLLTTVTALIAIALLAGQLIEDLQKSKVKINRLEELNEEIVESLDSGLIGLDEKGLITKINRTAQQFLGLNRVSHVLGKPLNEVFPQIAGVSRNQVKELMIQGKPHQILVTEVDLPEKNSMILLRDLTEVLSLEEKIKRQERLASVGQLATGIAHEIRNPVASISGAAELLKGEVEDEAELERLSGIIVRESERVDRLVQELLQFARPSKKERTLINLSEIIEAALDALQTRKEFKALGLCLDVDVDKSIRVNVNRDEFTEVITNLLVNAVQSFEEEKEANQQISKKYRIAVSAKKTPHGAELIVSDNGPGIPREFRSRIFDPFFTTKQDGTGLGLSHVHKIIRDYKGEINLESGEGQGTKLKIRLPS